MSTRPQSLTHIWSLTKYRGGGFTVQDIIDQDIGYVAWCIENNYLLLDDEAYAYFEGISNP